MTEEYRYSPDNAISPPDKGVRILGDGANECIKPFIPLTFGVTLDENAWCKIDPRRKRDYEDMSLFFNTFANMSHSYTLRVLNSDVLESEGLALQNGGEFTYYVRCEDNNGNSNVANFLFSFCVDDSADLSAPIIEQTSLLNNAPIGFGQTSIDLQIGVNKPSECKWSHLDQSYDDMEIDMSCSTSVFDMNAQMLYPCTTTLTGLNDNVNNDFYFRCKSYPDKPEEQRYANSQSYKFTLIGTRPLVIDSVGPNETIKDSTDIVKVTLEVETSAGYKEGESSCYFSNTGAENSFVKFLDTESYQHSQDLWLPEGDYTYHIKCVDLGGNLDSATTSFTIETDTQAPVVVRAFHETTFLKLITNEKAECVYSTDDCSYLFEDGIEMNVVGDTGHTTNWDPNTSFYIKCQDEFGNRPFPDQCSIRVRPFET